MKKQGGEGHKDLIRHAKCTRPVSYHIFLFVPSRNCGEAPGQQITVCSGIYYRNFRTHTLVHANTAERSTISRLLSPRTGGYLVEKSYQFRVLIPPRKRIIESNYGFGGGDWHVGHFLRGYRKVNAAPPLEGRDVTCCIMLVVGKLFFAPVRRSS
jgi:hypothetical protein